jgi:hypothetical protein
MEDEEEMEEDMEDEMMDLDAEDSYDSESPDEIPAKVTRLPEPKKAEAKPVAKASKQVVPDSDSEDEDDKLAASDSDEDDDSEDEADLAAIMA